MDQGHTVKGQGSIFEIENSVKISMYDCDQYKTNKKEVDFVWKEDGSKWIRVAQ